MEDEFTDAQQGLLVKLIKCFEEECKTIRDVYNGIKKRHEEERKKKEEGKLPLNYWFHEDFVVPLKTFVKWYNNKQQEEQKEPEEWKVTNNQARAVLDYLYGSE